MTEPTGPGRGVSRRKFVAGVVGGIGVSAVAAATTGAPAFAATPSPSPTLPGEYARTNNQTSRYTGTLFDNIVVKINGDPARIFIPQTIKPNSGVPIKIVWLYHGAGSDHNALNGGFKTTGERIIDTGAIAICQNVGGTLYSNPTAQQIQTNGYAYMAKLYNIAGSYLRATSGGGALACWTYATRLIPKILGMYNVNAVYDLEALEAQPGEQADSIAYIFNNDPVAVHESNPQKFPASNWAHDNVRIIVSQPDSSDTVVPPEQHGLALLSLVTPVAAEASLRTHANGHNTPGFADLDFVAAMARWQPDTTPPATAVAEPVNGATVSGVVGLLATATDDVGIASVVFTFGQYTLSNTTKGDGNSWWVQADTTTSASPDGVYAITSIATDVNGNVTTSAPISVTVKNTVGPPDTTAPVVAMTSPVGGATVSGVVPLVATATDNVGVTAVTFTFGQLTLPTATRNGDSWQVQADTTTATTPDGVYAVTATATDARGNRTTSAPVSVTVKNTVVVPPDTTAPTVAITSPVAGATVSGTVTVKATASDNVGVTGVSLYSSNRLIGPATLAGGVWSLTFNTKTGVTPNGAYTFVAKATDAAGNVGTSAPVAITIKN